MSIGWNITKIGQVCTVIAGQSPKGSYYNDQGDGLPFYQGKKLFGEKFVKAPTKWTTQVTKEAEAGDILMSVRAPVGPINFSTEKICIGRGLAAIRVSDNVDRNFLFYILLSKQKEISGNEGAVFASINKKQIEDIDIPLPPLPEQKRIVAILDKAFVGIDTAIANTEKNLANARELFESYLNEVFAKKRDGWKDIKLGEACVVERGSSPRPIKAYLTDGEDGVNWVKIGDTKGITKYIKTTKQKITQEGALRSRRVEPGDFILTNSMSYGRPYIMAITGYIHDGWFVLRLKEHINPDYFYHLLSSRLVQEQFGVLAAGAVVKNISSDLVKKTILPIPPMEQQVEIVAEIEMLSEQVQQLESIYGRKLSALTELKQSLLQKAFSGELTSENNQQPGV